MATLELWLYDGIAATGTIEYSTVSAAGPWTAVPLPSPMALQDALAYWTATISAAISPEAIDLGWYPGPPSRVQYASSIVVWLRLPETLAALLGFSSTVVADGDISDMTPTGIATVDAVGRTQPRDIEQASLRKIRGGRATTYHWGRAVEVTFDFAIPPSQWEDLEGAALVSGHGRLRITDTNTNAYGEDDLDGYLDVWPLETTRLDHESPDDHVVIEVRGAMEDPA